MPACLTTSQHVNGQFLALLFLAYLPAAAAAAGLQSPVKVNQLISNSGGV